MAPIWIILLVFVISVVGSYWFAKFVTQFGKKDI